MDPVTVTIVSAFAAGAAKVVGEKAIAGAYQALKNLVVAGYGKAKDLLVAIDALEAKPDSAGRRETLGEELKAAGVIDDDGVVTAAEAVLEAAAGAQTIGVDWQDVKANRLKIGKIRARAGAIGFRAARMEISGEIEITEIDAGSDSGN